MPVVALNYNRIRKNVQECFIVKSNFKQTVHSTTSLFLFQKQASKGFLENNFSESCEKFLKKTSVMKSFALKNCYVTGIFFLVEILKNYLNPTRRSSRFRDPTSLQGSRWPSRRKRYNAVISIGLVRLSPR